MLLSTRLQWGWDRLPHIFQRLGLETVVLVALVMEVVKTIVRESQTSSIQFVRYRCDCARGRLNPTISSGAESDSATTRDFRSVV